MLLYRSMSFNKLVYGFLFVYIFGVFCQNITFASDFSSWFNENKNIENVQNDEWMSNEDGVEDYCLWETLAIDVLDNNLLSGVFWQSGLVLDTSGVFLQEQENSLNVRENFDVWWQDVEEIVESQSVVEISTLNDNELAVSEVYFDGTDERIEIFNIWNNSFLWSLIISWVKSSLLTLDNIQIQPQSYIIVWDNLSSNSSLDNSYISQWLSISDTKSIDIKLFQNAILLDSFFVSQDIVDIANSQSKTSFHKLLDTRDILLTSENTTINTNEWYSANPWIIYTSLDIWWNDDSTWSVNTGSLILPNLKITEVFPYWEDVWFELTNFSENDFSWTLIISGFSSWRYDFDIFIPQGSSKILSNNERYFQDLDIVDFVSNSLQVSLDSNLFLGLYYEENLLDSFQTDQTWLEYLDWFDSSLEKIGTGESWITTYVWLNTDRYYNTSRWYAANPWKVFTSAENIIDLTIPKDQDTTPNLTWLDTLCNGLDDTYLNISEYYNWDDRYPMYVEVDILDDRMTDIFVWLYFSWTAISGINPYFDFYDYYDRDEDVFLMDFSSNKKILFSNQDFRYDEMQDALFRTWFDIQTWLLEIYGFDGDEYTLLDVISISDIQSTKSTYYDWEDFQCVRSFSDIDSFSPGFDKKYSKYFETIAIECPVCNCGGGWIKYISEFNSQAEISSDIEISSIKYIDENNQIIKIKNKSNFPVNMREYSFQILVGEEKTSSFQWNTAMSKSITSFVGSYWLPKYDSCINLMNNNQVVDRYCYATLSKPSESDLKNISKQLDFRSDLEESDVSTGSIQSWLNYSIQIQSILYDPEWLDYWNENIKLFLMSGDKVDLNSCSLQIKKDNTSTNKKINWILNFWKIQTFVWNYSFPNSTKDGKPVQVNLLCEDVLLDSYIYNPNQEEKIEEELENLEEIKNLNIKIQSIIYDPEWNDTDRESISLFLQTGEDIKLTKDFYLYFNNKKRYLNSDETISHGELLSITGNFQFPNSQETCVDLMYKEELLDSFCYNPNEEIISSWLDISQYLWLEIKIISVLPNPIGNDSEWEEVIFQSNQDVILDKNFYIKINNSQKSLENTQLLQNQHTSVVKNFSLPNSSSCVYLYHWDKKMDEFCYSDPLEWQKFTQNNGILSSIDVGDFEILKKIEFKTFWDSICSIIYDQKISCKKLPYSKLSQIKEKQNSFYKSYLSLLQSYLSQNRPIVYYNTDIQKHFSLYKQIDQQIKAGDSTITIEGKIYSISDYQKIYQEKYPDNVLDLLSNTISPIIPEQIRNIYQKSYQKYQEVK